MLQERALVVAIQGDSAWVEVKRQSSCSACQSGSSCGTSVIASFFPQRSMRLQVPDHQGAQVGQWVMVGLDESALQSAALLVYILPLVGLIGGAILGQWLGNHWWSGSMELASVAFGLLGMLTAFGAVRWIAHRWAAQPEYQAQILYLFPKDNPMIQEML